MTRPPPRKKFVLRDYVGGLAAMLFGFGFLSFLMGSAMPWGYQQVGGLIAAILGLILMFVRLWLPRA